MSPPGRPKGEQEPERASAKVAPSNFFGRGPDDDPIPIGEPDDDDGYDEDDDEDEEDEDGDYDDE